MENIDLKKFYKKFEKGCYNDVGTLHFCSPVENSESISNKVSDTYYKIYAIKTKFSPSQNIFTIEEIESPKYCIYFKYWFYDQIINYELDDTELMKLFDLKGRLYLDGIFPCKFNIKDLEEIKKVRLLLYYLLNCAVSTTSAPIYNIFCSYGLSKCLNEVIDLYNIRTKCDTIYHDNLCKELNEYYQATRIERLPMFECDEGIGTPVYNSLQEETPANIVLQERILPESGNSLVRKSIIATILIFGLLFIFFVLHKVTPFKRHLRDTFLKKRKIEHKQKEEQNEFAEYMSEYDNMKNFKDEHQLLFYVS
ncbi:variable surface protein [Plasmodium gonderi]|uniref:Variable surface protein n=1 Tax=Plasmodium gonderi TaxID=77519 RepID=A0A1Y1JW54_PLAGO|nr:variable surface protein [Plasmodium gonderi]GAW84104.1 variable surface protein [Plasmodium gonderi]